MYGLSFTANLLCASATRRFASATLLAKSSVFAGEPECEPTAGDSAGLGDATAEAEAEADDDAEGRCALFFIAAILAVISARFCAMRSAVACSNIISVHP